jgi:uncharacterized protein YndB with AHSA1/START domain
MSGPRTLRMVRQLAASREAVFRAWTDPTELAWFADGPPRTPTTVDLRVGGAWRLHMVQADGREYMTGGIYREIVAPERLRFSWGAVDGWPALDPDDLDTVPTLTVELTEAGGGTAMVVTVDFPDRFSDSDVQVWFGWGIREGWAHTIDRLGPYLSATHHEARSE